MGGALTPRRLVGIGLAVFALTMLVTSLLPYEGKTDCSRARANGLGTSSDARSRCTAKQVPRNLAAHPGLSLLGLVIGGTLIGIGIRRGGTDALLDNVLSSSHLRDPHAPLPHVRPTTKRGPDTEPRPAPAPGAGAAPLPVQAAPPPPSALPGELVVDRFAELLTGTLAADGSHGWWIEVPDGAGLLQVDVRTSPMTAVALHVAVDGQWIETAGPDLMLAHRLQLPAGTAWVYVAAMQPPATPTSVDVDVRSIPGAAAAA